MKKIWLMFLIIFMVIDGLLLWVNITPYKKYVNEIDNDKIHVNMVEGYYLTSNYKNDTETFKLYSDDKKSSISITVLEQLPSNKLLYTDEELSRGINYQVLKNIKGYEEEKFMIRNNYSYSKNHNGNNIIEVIVRQENLVVLVIAYATSKDLYNSELITKLNENIILK